MSFVSITASTLAITIMSGILFYTWKRRSRLKVRMLFWVTALMIVASVAHVGEMMHDTHSAKLFWRNVAQLGLLPLPALTLLFVYHYLELKQKVLERLIQAGLGLSFLAVLLIYTNDFHGIMRVETFLDPTFSPPYLAVVSTTFGRFIVGLNIVYGVASMVLLAHHYLRSGDFFRKRALWLIVGIAIPIAYTYLRKMTETIGLPLSISTTFLISISVMYFALIRYDFVEVSPISKSFVMETINQGILVFLKNGALADHNSQALAMLGCPKEEVCRLIQDHFPKWHDALNQNKSQQFRIEDFPGKDQGIFKVEIIPLKKKEEVIGIVSVLTDVTLEVLTQNKLRKSVEIDGLTGALNRNAFEKTVDRHVQQGHRGSLAVFDVDRFKSVNDRYGHAVGDDVLKTLTSIAKRESRSEDLVGRLGGDEFLLYLHQIGPDQLPAVLKRLQEAVRLHLFSSQGQTFGVTLSIGTATIDGELPFETLYKQADEALYEAKNRGRDQSVMASELASLQSKP